MNTMKQHLVAFPLIIMMVVLNGTVFAQQSNPKGSTQSIDIINVSSGIKPIRPRSVKPVEAYIYYDFEELEVNFNDDLGKVVVVLQDQTGQEVCSYRCDTNTEPAVSLPLPMSEGAYTLRIVGDAYEGEGIFDL